MAMKEGRSPHRCRTAGPGLLSVASPAVEAWRSRTMICDAATFGLNITNNYESSGGIVGVDKAATGIPAAWVLAPKAIFS